MIKKLYISILDFWDEFFKKIRVNQCLKYCQGRILDIGCGHNNLVRKYGQGVGVDVFPWEGADLVCDTTQLPFQENEFNRVFLLACLNHIPEREKVLKEALRVLKPGGMIIITMITPKIGYFWHKVGGPFWEDHRKRGMKEKEVYGMTKKNIESLLIRAGFKELRSRKFAFGLNTIYSATKP